MKLAKEPRGFREPRAGRPRTSDLGSHYCRCSSLKPNLVRDIIQRAPTSLESKRVQQVSAWEQKPELLPRVCERT